MSTLPRNHRTVTGRLTSADRYRSSSNGNPTWSIVLDETDAYLTQTDSSVGYEVGNFRIGMLVTLTMTGSDRVYDMVNAIDADR